MSTTPSLAAREVGMQSKSVRFIVPNHDPLPRDGHTAVLNIIRVLLSGVKEGIDTGVCPKCVCCGEAGNYLYPHPR